MRVPLRFADPEQEKRFLAKNRQEQAAYFSKAIVVGLLIAFGFLWQDSIITATRGYIATDIRIYAITPACVIALWLLATKKLPPGLIEPTMAALYLLYGLAAIAIEIVFEGTPYGLTSSVGSGTVLLLTLACFTFTSLRFFWALSVGIGILLMYAAAMYWSTAEPFGDFLAGDFLTTVVAGVVGASTSLFRERYLRKEFDASEKYLSLLYRLVPQAIAERIQKGEFPIADTHAEVTILFADLVGFTALAGKLPSLEIVQMLNQLFQRFDEAAVRYGVEKLKTIGDGYMAMCGPPVEETRRVGNIVGLAEEMLAIVDDFPEIANTKLQLRIGINTGTVVAGVIGRDRFTYDVWGETVNTASRMESTGLPGRIQVSQNARRWLRGDFEFEPHSVHAHGIGDIETFLLRHDRGKLH